MAFYFTRINKGGLKMIKRLVEFSELEQINMIISGTSYAMFKAQLDKKLKKVN